MCVWEIPEHRHQKIQEARPFGLILNMTTVGDELAEPALRKIGPKSVKFIGPKSKDYTDKFG